MKKRIRRQDDHLLEKRGCWRNERNGTSGTREKPLTAEWFQSDAGDDWNCEPFSGRLRRHTGSTCIDFARSDRRRKWFASFSNVKEVVGAISSLWI
jgi:hypothetical protein